MTRPCYIGSEIYRNSSYGPKHPLAMQRVPVCTDLCHALGWLSDAVYHDAPMASVAVLTRFHDPEYIAALQRAEATQTVSEADRARFRIGAKGNPVYWEVYGRPAISAGGIMLAARLTADGGVAHCPGGGTHRGRPDRATGFCFLNDPVLGLLAWLDVGLDNIVCLDIDAHHGDGVQDAFRDDPRVFTISLHEAGRWPFTGAAYDRAGGAARNFPLPAQCNDSEFAWVMRHAVLPLIEACRPQAIMLQAGADALEEDPLARLSLSNNVHCAVAASLLPLAPTPRRARRRLQSVVGRPLLGRDLGHAERLPMPDRRPDAAEQALRGARFNRAAGHNPPGHWFTTLRDAPREGVVRSTVKRLADQALKESLSA
ncbi:MAG: acetoin utilization protein AcuC [Acetobacteraceae bacterium]|nr:acetoin utilization protein AcuC [Acetobacteraceae bacterium]